MVELDTRDSGAVIDVLVRAAEANLTQAGRRGSVLDLPGKGRLLISGDLHDNAQNFLRLVKLAQLDRSPDHHLILHELIHGPGLINGCDLSVRMLARVAALKLAYPKQVHIMQANHDLAQMLGEGILKEGINVVDAFEEGLAFLYDHRADDVRAAMNRFIRSYLLAVRCQNGVMCCHSLPSPRKLEHFDRTVLDRSPTEADLENPGSVYQLVWGRNHTQKVADVLGEAWGARQFVLGHQPAEMGYEVEGQTMLILASDHGHGVGLPIDLARQYDRDALIEQIVPLAAVSVG